jgi:hypothetical protein
MLADVTSDLGPAPTTGDAWRTVGFIVLAIVAQCVAWYAFTEADGDWMRFIGGGGRSPAVPMWVIFGLWTFLTLFGLAGVAAYLRLIIRHITSQPRDQDRRDPLRTESVD